MRWWTSPEDEAVSPVFVAWMGDGVLEFGKDFVDCYACEVGREQFAALLGVAVGSVRGVAGLDLGLYRVVSSAFVWRHWLGGWMGWFLLDRRDMLL